MEFNVPSIIKGFAQLFDFLGMTYTPPTYTTFNEKLQIQSGVALNPGERPTLGYMMVGIGGLAVGTGADGFTYVRQLGHTPADTALFQELPFLVRPAGSDIDATTRQQYRMRRLETHNNNPYICYYAKVLDLSGVTPQLVTRTVVSGVLTQAPMSLSSANLNPTPYQIPSGTSETVAGQYVCASAVVPFTLSAQDVIELLNSSLVVYGDEDHAVISEICPCIGVDRSVQSNAGGTLVTYTEAICLQAAGFLSTNFPSASSPSGKTWNFDVGSVEPVMVLVPS